MPEEQGGWGEYRMLILQELKQLHEEVKDVKSSLTALSFELSAVKAQIAVLQVKSGVWGFFAGAVPSAAAVVYAIFKT